MAAKTCRVSFKDLEGVRHAVEVQAETMYEAAVLGLRALKRSDWIDTIGAGTRIDIEVMQPPVAHFVMYAQLQRWLDGGGTNPAEIVKKKKLKELLAS
jgi:hypothetical protein